MTWMPDFEIGLWNVWIIAVVFYAAAFLPLVLGGERVEARVEGEDDSQDWGPGLRAAYYVDHLLLMPLTLLYAVFVPLERDNWWLYSGLVVSAIAIVMVLSASVSFATAPTDRPMSTGVYAISRHPMYVSKIVLFVGMGLAGSSWVFLVCAAVDIYVWRMAIPEEEQVMLAKYGAAYQDYIDRTPRWLGPASARKHAAVHQ